MLHHAIARGEPFYLQYSHLPDFTGLGGGGGGDVRVSTRVRVTVDSNGQLACAVFTKGGWLGEHKAPCEPGELALLPPPPLWARKLMLSWPYPVLEGEPETQSGLCFGE